MAMKKKTPELIFELQWRQKPNNGGDKSNFIGIGIYDTPSTTSDFQKFKCYLLKNSGVGFNDVKVTYVTDNGQEWVIDSQEAFEVALNSFRLKAKLGEVIRLKLDKVLGRRHCNDVETQSDGESLGAAKAAEVVPPEWFINYMKQFKKEIVDEIISGIDLVNIITADETNNVREQEQAAPKKPKPETCKRPKRHLSGDMIDVVANREMLKALKFDRKLETKLDKLDAKTKKIKEKKQALLGRFEHGMAEQEGASQVDPCRNWRKNYCPMPTITNREIYLNAALVDPFKGFECPRMTGGEIYLHTWRVINNGQIAWDDKTVLKMTWGTDLVPSLSPMKCPPLQPGEQGTISVRFTIPKNPGKYESYWNFFDNMTRFGQTLHFIVIVEQPLRSILTEPKPEKADDIFLPKPIWDEEAHEAKEEKSDSKVIDLSKRMETVKIRNELDSDSDWESVCSYNRNLTTDAPRKSNTYGITDSELMMNLAICPEKVEEPENPEDKNNNGSVETLENISEASDISSGYDVLQVPPEAAEAEESGYVYINIDGNRLSVPKYILRPDVVAAAEDAPAPPPKSPDLTQQVTELTESTKMLESYVSAVEEVSHCSATGSCFSDTEQNRRFVFPERQPGYEVVSEAAPSAPSASEATTTEAATVTPVHILPENLVSGAVNVASSAINTARTVINMIAPSRTEPGRWVDGHWVSNNPDSLRSRNLNALREMGFYDADLNATLLGRYNDDLGRVINELVQ